MAQRLIPSPFASLITLAVWLVLNSSLAPAQILLGVSLAVALPHVTAPFAIGSSRLKRPLAALDLAAVFGWDLLAANIEVAVLVLGPRRRLRPRVVEVPLTVSSPLAVSTLAGIISLTPGTVSVELSADCRILTVHGLRVLDAGAAAAQLKARYERRLLEVFEC